MPVINQQLESHSLEMEEIVGNIPSWVVRWGITVLFTVALIGLSVCSFVRYPDTIRTDVLIEAINQPGKITITRSDANQIFHYYVKDGSKVKPGDTLLTLEDKKTGEVKPTITPMSGTVYITNGANENNILQDVMWVVPNSNSAKIKIKYKNQGAGNVKVGQAVKIDLYDFPQSEYGFLQGHISNILPIQENGQHIAYVKLINNKIVTSENHIIPLHPIMEGSGEILLNDRSIFQRIFGSVYH